MAPGAACESIPNGPSVYLFDMSGDVSSFVEVTHGHPESLCCDMSQSIRRWYAYYSASFLATEKPGGRKEQHTKLEAVH